MQLMKIAKEFGGKAKAVSTNKTVSNAAFRFHYQFTTGILLLCAAMCSLHDLIGKPIQCMGEPKARVHLKSANIFCYITSTFSLPKTYHLPHEEVVYPGLGAYKEGDEQVFHSYYVWVPFMLVLQAVTFYIPRHLWKIMEKGRLTRLLGGFSGLVIKNLKKREVEKDDYESGEEPVDTKSEDRVTEYILDHLNCHRVYYASYIFCEILNFIITIVNLVATDRFLGGEFSTYGIDALKFMNQDPEDRTDPMSLVFPTVTKCTFRSYGFSGTIIKYDYLCVLAQNIINEKIYFFLYFWFLLMIIIGAFAILNRLATMLLSTYRLHKLKSSCYPTMRTRSCNECRTALPVKNCNGGCCIKTVPQLQGILTRCDWADWFFLNEMGCNLEKISFTKLMYALSKKMVPNKSSSIRQKDLKGNL